MAAMGSTALGGMPPDPMAPPVPMPAPMAGPGPVTMGMGGPMPPATSTPLNGAGAAPGTAVDLGGMGAPPVMAPDQDDLIMSALQAVLGKWGNGQAQMAGEKESLLQTLMLLASSQPPTAPEAFVEGGAPTAFGMAPADPMLPSAGSAPVGGMY